MGLQQKIFTFDNLAKFPGLFHAVTTKKFPSVRRLTAGIISQNVQNIAEDLNLSGDKLVCLEQVHGNKIILNPKLPNGLFRGVDGVVLSERNLFGSIMTADCLPVIAYDPRHKIVGLAHAGYKGLQHEIINSLVLSMLKLGSNSEDLVCAIGPSIGVCCYNIPNTRFKQFQKFLPNTLKFYRMENRNVFLDLKTIAVYQLRQKGVTAANIEIADYCTYHDNDLFYSYRREGENFGEFMTIAGLL